MLKGDEDDGRHRPVLELDESIEGRRNNADDVADYGNEVEKEVQHAPDQREIEPDQEGDGGAADPGHEAGHHCDPQVAADLSGGLLHRLDKPSQPFVCRHAPVPLLFLVRAIPFSGEGLFPPAEP